jgi:hypothetical protein
MEKQGRLSLCGQGKHRSTEPRTIPVASLPGCCFHLHGPPQSLMNFDLTPQLQGVEEEEPSEYGAPTCAKYYLPFQTPSFQGGKPR